MRRNDTLMPSTDSIWTWAYSQPFRSIYRIGDARKPPSCERDRIRKRGQRQTDRPTYEPTHRSIALCPRTTGRREATATKKQSHSLTAAVTPTPTILMPRLLMSSASPGRRSVSYVGLPSVMRTMVLGMPGRSP